MKRKYFGRSAQSMVGLLVGAAVFSGCDVDQEEPGKLPDVDVSAEGGQMPEFKQTKEMKLPDVDVDTEAGELPEYTVRGPDVDVEMEERTVRVPDVDVDLPEEHESEEMPNDVARDAAQ